jgi:2-polyprenyl-3-methyl-5-hydroxy-6-metoxy-1,4-benzoquinol methylase
MSGLVRSAEADAVVGGLACPLCSEPIAQTPDVITCDGCGRRYPVVGGIPDLRLSYPDPYLSWEGDLEDARRLAALFEARDFEGLLREHWGQTGKPAELADRFRARDLNSQSTFESYLAATVRARGRELTRADRVLEIGCGTAGLAAAAAGRAGDVVASDISMRWLVLAKKRLLEAGITDVRLICCAAEEPPFLPESFDLIVASDVIEHAAQQVDFVAGCRYVLKDEGMLFLATPNRFSLALEPHVRLWGVGLLPRRVAPIYVRMLRGTGYDHVRLLSAFDLRRLLGRQGFSVELASPEIPEGAQQMYTGLERRLIRAYNRVRQLPGIRPLLLLIGPFFHVFATKGKR